MDTLAPFATRTSKSLWNKAVVEVFVKGVLSSDDPNLPSSTLANYHDRLTHYTFARLGSWRVKYQSDADAKRLQRMRAWYEQKCQLWLHRHDAVGNHAETQRHLKVLADLGVKGMSSGGSDHTSTSGQK
jgi:hypothetical protein